MLSTLAYQEPQLGIAPIVGPKFNRQMSARQFERFFADDDACKAYLVARRWPQGIRCPRCENSKVYPDRNRPFHWQCTKCTVRGGYRFSVLVGTIFENASTGLRTWFQVIRLILISKNSISAAEIHRLVGLGHYDTVRTMAHRIRIGLTDPAFRNLIGIEGDDEPNIGVTTSGVPKTRAKRTGSLTEQYRPSD